ncbi:MAG TPA: hypothetical protein VKV39_06850 [Candidatus Sulfotelmatobacter sp.]|nr:hypothetical protein [Candidatus Sulfotelmatobacter sp.]
MNCQAAQNIANVVLYEGYILYPYRPSAVKNRQRFNFGVIYPREYCQALNSGDSWQSQTEVLVRGGQGTRVDVRVKFLQLIERSVLARNATTNEYTLVDQIEVDGKNFSSWQEAVEQEISIDGLPLTELVSSPKELNRDFAQSVASEPICNEQGGLAGEIVRNRETVNLHVIAVAEQVATNVHRLSVRIANPTAIHPSPKRQQALMRAAVSCHVILGVEQGEFVSLIDTPDELRELAAACRNVGLFPVLVGLDGSHDTMMASPIILYDHPQVAPESAGELFDGTEIDEILSLRILALTDQEKKEMRASDARSRQILDRTEALPAEQFMKLHGVLRSMRPLKNTQDGIDPHE